MEDDLPEIGIGTWRAVLPHLIDRNSKWAVLKPETLVYKANQASAGLINTLRNTLKSKSAVAKLCKEIKEEAELDYGTEHGSARSQNMQERKR